MRRLPLVFVQRHYICQMFFAFVVFHVFFSFFLILFFSLVVEVGSGLKVSGLSYHIYTLNVLETNRIGGNWPD